MPRQEQERYIELSRRFRKLEKKIKSEDAAVESYTQDLLARRDDIFDWGRLLGEDRVVILGEPGSGKTWELRKEVGRLNATGAMAFFVRLDQLIDTDLLTLLDTAAKARFDAWRTGTKPAYFFLDSVDEAKFRRLSDFHLALQKFQHTIGVVGLSKAKVYLSSRISEWQPLTDEFQFRQILPMAPSAGGPTREELRSFPLVVSLEPLSRDQVEKFAQAKGVADVAGFVHALDSAFAWEFARRPLDVSDLVEFWKEKRRIGSLTEMIEFDIGAKLRSRPDRAELDLSDEKKREGVTWLAAASVFSRKFSFFVPDESSADVDALRPLAVLPSNWTETQARALLNRAIFDSAVYGRLRFHHRRVSEFLAAEWIAGRMDSGCQPLDLERILSANVRGNKISRPSLRPIAAWLCNGNARWNEFARELVLKTDPKLHLQYGDPSSLSIEYRRKVLSALAESSRDRRRIWFDTSSDALARIAHPTIATDISAHILNSNLADDFRIELLGIVQHGRLTDCIDSAMTVLYAQTESSEVKSAVVRAVGAIGDRAVLARLAQYFRALPTIPNLTCVAAVQVLFPKAISPAQLVELLEKIDTVKEFGVDLPYFLDAHLQHVLTGSDTGPLLIMLLDLAESPPHYVRGNETVYVSQKHWWLGKVIPTVTEVLLEKNKLTPNEVTVAVRALWFLGQFQRRWHFGRHEVGDINSKTIPHADVRLEYFWFCVAKFRRENIGEPVSMAQIFDYYQVLKPDRADFDLLTQSAKDRPEKRDKELALRMAVEIWDSSGRRISDLWLLWSIATTDDALLKIFWESPYTSILFPIRKFWWRRIRFKFGKWWWLRRIDLLKERWRWLSGQRVLLMHLKQLRSGKALGWLSQLCNEASEGGSSWATASWEKLAKRRGRIITRAAKQGCVSFWRGYRPPLPHEKPQQNTTSVGTVVGLTGLQIEFDENPGVFENLTHDEAVVAARYAMDEMNEFPTWFWTLARTKPEAVENVLGECIEAEWKFPAEHPRPYEVMHKVARPGGEFIPLVQRKLRSLLDAGDPENFLILRLTLAVLTHEGSSSLLHLVDLAPHRVAVAATNGAKALWFAVWMGIDGMAAVQQLKLRLDTSPNGTELIVFLCSLLSGEDMHQSIGIKNPDYLKPTCLRRFIPIVFQYVKLSEDIHHEGAYTPSARDHAQRFRSLLLDYLAKTDAGEASDLLRQLADEPEMSQVRDWILNLLQQRLEKEADMPPWTADDLREFAELHETDPKNDRELFEIAEKRLQIVKWDVESAENSLRDEVRKDAPEFHLRRWLQRKLAERSQNRYTVPQEPEIDQRQRPDLRLENPKTAPIAIEVKWAERWTLSDLLEGLEKQLVGQYLRSYNSRYGIYVLGHIGDKATWNDTAGNSLALWQVEIIIRQRAFEIMQSNPRIGGLDVITIDFHEPKGN